MRTTGALQVEKKKQQQYQDVFLNKKIVAPEKLKILVLSGNDLVNDQLQFVQKCVSLIKLDLSNNHITSISSKIKMSGLKKLKMLYVHNNRIAKLDGLEGIFGVPQLTQLTIRDNPIERLPRIEHLLVNMIPTLKILGQRVVFVQQRSAEVVWERKNIFIEPQMAEGWKAKQNQQSHYIKILQVQLKYFDNVWVQNNPIVFLQRYWKKTYKVRQKDKVLEKQGKKISPVKTKIKKEENKFLLRYFEQWRQLVRNKISVYYALKNTGSYPEDKTYLTYPLKEYQISLRNFRVNKIIKNYVQKIREKIFYRKMAEKLQRSLNKKRIQFSGPQSFINLMKQKKFYFAKTQRHLIDNFLLHISNNFNWREKIHDNHKITDARNYLTIRLIDPEAFSLKQVYSTLTYLIWPSMRAIFLKKKKFQTKQGASIIKIKPLTYIKNRDKVLTKEQYKKTIKIYKQLEKFYVKEYESSIDCFECSDTEFMKMLIRYIFYHNTKIIKLEKKIQKNEMASLLQNYEEPFIFYTDDILERSSAAVKIQQNWRKYISNKKQAQSIFDKMKKTRAILKIQRFFRDTVFYHRLAFQKSLSNQIRLFKSSSFFLHKGIYDNIVDLTSQIKKISLYQGIKGSEQILKTRKTFYMNWAMDKNIFPPDIRQIIFEGAEEIEQVFASRNADIYTILHSDSTVAQIEYNNQKYLEFTFRTLQEAKLRICIIALLTYRAWDSKYILPLSKDTLDLEIIRLNEYQKFPVLSDIREKYRVRQFEGKDKKIIRNKRIQIKGMFLFDKQFPQQKQNIEKVYLEFYQKKFQDFPSKHHIQMKYFVPEYIVEEIKLENQMMMKDLLSKNIVLEEAYKTKKDTISVIQEDKMDSINVSKIDKKRVSLYDFGYKTGAITRSQKATSNIERRQEQETANLQRKQAQYHYTTNLKKNVKKIKQTQMSKRFQIMEKKKKEIGLIRENVQKQKNLNTTLKNMKELERNQAIKKKVEKVKQFKNRAISQKNQDEEDQFIQQGNFVMEQQLKMVIMRSKMKNVEVKKEQRKNETAKTGLNNKRRTSFSHTQSLYSQPQKNEQVPLNVLKNTISNNLGEEPSKQQQEAVGEQRKIMNIKPSRKSRANSIGAYLRDPSYVHGVFPQQYYPMETKSNFRFFPPL